jgi:hypothetical protein
MLQPKILQQRALATLPRTLTATHNQPVRTDWRAELKGGRFLFLLAVEPDAQRRDAFQPLAHQLA